MAEQNPFDGIELTKQAGRQLTKAPNSVAKANAEQRAELQAFYTQILPKGFAMPNYLEGWENQVIMGAISVADFVLFLRGNKKPGYKNAWLSGVTYKNWMPEEYAPTTCGQEKLARFGKLNWSVFKGLKADEQVKLLREAQVI